MTDEEAAAIRTRMQRAIALSNKAVIAGDNDLPFFRFCAANYIADLNILLAEVERLRARETQLLAEIANYNEIDT